MKGGSKKRSFLTLLNVVNEGEHLGARSKDREGEGDEGNLVKGKSEFKDKEKKDVVKREEKIPLHYS